MVTKTVINSVSVLQVEGELDSDNFPRLLRQAEEAFDEGYTDLIIDLRQVDHISSGGMIALQTIVARAAGRGGKAVLSGINHDTNAGLRVRESSKIFETFPNVNLAASSLMQV